MESYYIYSSDYDFSLPGISKLHPFDGHKFSKAWDLFFKKVNLNLNENWIKPEDEVSNENLLKIHTKEYLETLNSSKTIAQVIEVNLAKFIPKTILQSRLIHPIKLASQGTILATDLALKNNSIAMNFGGGYHHAFADHGEGFSFFGDAALAINLSRESNLLNQDDTVMMIDLDAHRGNGFESIFINDQSVKIFDMYNFQVYPGMHQGEMDDFPFMIPLRANLSGEEYLDTLKTELPKFIQQNPTPKLAFYNAGTDIYENDSLGGLKVSYEDVLERDKYVVEQLQKLQIPTVIITSGGYSDQSYKMIAELASTVYEQTK